MLCKWRCMFQRIYLCYNSCYRKRILKLNNIMDGFVLYKSKCICKLIFVFWFKKLPKCLLQFLIFYRRYREEGHHFSTSLNRRKYIYQRSMNNWSKLKKNIFITVLNILVKITIGNTLLKVVALCEQLFSSYSLVFFLFLY